MVLNRRDFMVDAIGIGRGYHDSVLGYSSPTTEMDAGSVGASFARDCCYFLQRKIASKARSYKRIVRFPPL
jgi:hypothetical protein